MKKCLQCGSEFEPKNPKGKFCSDKCRVYWNRKKGGLKTAGFTEDGKKLQMYIPVVSPEPKEKIVIPYFASNDKILGQIPPIPERMEGEDAIDFAARKNEWKKLYN